MFKKVFFFIIVFSLLLVPVFIVHAQYGIDVTAGQTPIKDFQSKSIQTMVGSILGQVLALIGILFFLLMIYGGVTWMTAAGNAEKEKKALGTMISATIGIIIVLSAYVLVNFVITKVGGGTLTNNNTPVVETVIDVGTGVGECVVDDKMEAYIMMGFACMPYGDGFEKDAETNEKCDDIVFCIWTIDSLVNFCNAREGKEAEYCKTGKKEQCGNVNEEEKYYYQGCKWEEK